MLAYNISEIGNIISKLRESQDLITHKLAVFERMIKRDRHMIKTFFNQQHHDDDETARIHRQKHLDKRLEERIFTYIRELDIDKGNLEYL